MSRKIPEEEHNGTIFCEALNCEVARPTEHEANKEAIMKAIPVIDMLIGICTVNGCDREKIDHLTTAKLLLNGIVIPYLDVIRDCYEKNEK